MDSIDQELSDITEEAPRIWATEAALAIDPDADIWPECWDRIEDPDYPDAIRLEAPGCDTGPGPRAPFFWQVAIEDGPVTEVRRVSLIGTGECLTGRHRILDCTCTMANGATLYDDDPSTVAEAQEANLRTYTKWMGIAARPPEMDEQ